MTDWRRIGVPQDDGFDTVQILQMAEARWGYVARYDGGPRMLGTELIRGTAPVADGVEPADLGHENIGKVAAALSAWPLSEGLLWLPDFYTPYVSQPPRSESRGCMSGHEKPSKGSRIGIYTTIDDPIGAAEGIVHEIAHQRLHCLGVDLDKHDGTLFENDNELRWFSPIRRDILRPMCALVHGVYAYTFVLEIDLANGAEGAQYAQQNLPKVRRGLEEIKKGVVVTQAGAKFFRGYFEWAENVVRRAEDVLAKLGLDEVMWQGGIRG